MKRFRVRTPSASTSIALVALFLAVGGTSYAASQLQSVKVVGPVGVKNASGPVQVAGNLGVHAASALPVSGHVTVSGSTDPSPETVLAKGECNNAGNAVTATIPNTTGLRIRQMILTQTNYNSGSARLSLFAPGDPTTGDPLVNVFAGDLAAQQYISLPGSMDFGAGLSSSTSGSWTVICSSTTNQTSGSPEEIWTVLGSN